MADPRFYHRAGSLGLNDLVSEMGNRTELTLAPEADGSIEICDVAPLNSAGPQDISFLDNPKYAAALSATKAVAVLVRERDVAKVPAGCAAIIAKDPYRAYAIIAHRFYPDQPENVAGEDAARIDPSARIEVGVSLAPGVCIGPDVEIGSGTRIGPNTVIGHGCTIGRDCRIGANVSISYAIIGDRVGLYSGAIIGEEGFGFAMGAGGHLKVPQLGRVILQDDVEVGANSTIDRGAGPDTIIGEGTKIDNLVQIGHNVQTGRHCVLAGQVGIAGSTVLEDYVVLGGQAGVAGHLKIGMGAQIGGCSGVMRDVPAGERQVGAPARDVRIFMKETAWLSKMAKTKGKKE